MRSLILPSLLILSIFACTKPNDKSYLPDEYANPKLTSVTLRDTLPASSLANLFIQESKGVKATYVTGRFTTYFEYNANQQDLLKTINTLPFDINTRLSDTLCRKIDGQFSLSGKQFLSNEEIESSSFFWNINPEDFTYYECIKSPMRHTILLDKHSNRILHRIEIES
jgi:hypothetical protein